MAAECIVNARVWAMEPMHISNVGREVTSGEFPLTGVVNRRTVYLYNFSDGPLIPMIKWQCNTTIVGGDAE
jgi:hypothetical protein